MLEYKWFEGKKTIDWKQRFNFCLGKSAADTTGYFSDRRPIDFYWEEKKFGSRRCAPENHNQTDTLVEIVAAEVSALPLYYALASAVWRSSRNQSPPNYHPRIISCCIITEKSRWSKEKKKQLPG